MLTTIAALILGVLIGAGGHDGSPTADAVKSSSLYTALQAKLTSAESQRDQLQRSAASNTAATEAVAAEKVSLLKRSKALDAREKKLNAQAAKVKKQASAVKAAASTTSSSSTSSSSSSSVYHQNCTAARAAGAAPLYVGDPAYRPALDRDGDGVACE